MTTSLYQQSPHSTMAIEAITAAWDKLSLDDKAVLLSCIDSIAKYQQAVSRGRDHRPSSLGASSGIELLGKLGMFLAGVKYPEFIMDEKGKTK